MHKHTKKPTPAAMSGRCRRRNDILLIGALFIVISVTGLLLLLLQSEGDAVRVTVDGALYGTYALAEDARVEIRTGEGGEQLNVLVIRGGKAYVEHATCPDGICAAHRPICHNNESIACLPHRVAITVYTDEDTPDVIV